MNKSEWTWCDCGCCRYFADEGITQLQLDRLALAFAALEWEETTQCEGKVSTVNH